LIKRQRKAVETGGATLQEKVTVGQVGLSGTTLARCQLEVEQLGADNPVLGQGALGIVVLGKWNGAKVKLGECR